MRTRFRKRHAQKQRIRCVGEEVALKKRSDRRKTKAEALFEKEPGFTVATAEELAKLGNFVVFRPKRKPSKKRASG